MMKKKDKILKLEMGQVLVDDKEKLIRENILIMNGNHAKSVDKPNPVSSNDIDGVDRYKYQCAPFSINGSRLVLPLRSSLVSAPLKRTTPVLEEWIEKKPLESSILSSSSGYQSSRSSSRIQAISDRLYANGHRIHICSRSQSIGESNRSPKQMTIPESPLPDIPSSRKINRMQIRRRSMSPLKRPATTSTMTILINIEQRQNMDEIKEKLTWRGEKLRREIEEKLKHVRIRHEKAMRILRDQQPQSIEIDRSYPIAPIPTPPTPGEKGYVRRKRISKTRLNKIGNPHVNLMQSNAIKADEQNQVSQSTNNCCDYDQTKFLDQCANHINLVDTALVQKDIIEPLIDAVLRDSVTSLSTHKADESSALDLSNPVDHPVYDDVEKFLYNAIIPNAVQVAEFTSSNV